MSAKADPPRGYWLSAIGYRRDTLADKRWLKADNRPSVCRSHRRKASGAIAVPPAGFVVDRTRIRLGGGARTFAAAKAALERWLGQPAFTLPNQPLYNRAVRTGFRRARKRLFDSGAGWAYLG